MSETILKILLSELSLVRFTCRACKAAVEVPIDGLDRVRQTIGCPGCGAVIRQVAQGRPDAFDSLAEAARGLKSRNDFDAAFVVPVPDPAK